MKLWAPSLLLLLAGCGCSTIPSHNDLRATTLSLRFANGLCSGTAIAPDQILTARHCLEGGELRTANQRIAKIASVSEEKLDRVVLTITKPIFTRWTSTRGTVAQGDRVRWWGSPHGLPDTYREAKVARSTTDRIVIDAMVCPGDSGSAVFNDRGEIVAVLIQRMAVPQERAVCMFAYAIPPP